MSAERPKAYDGYANVDWGAAMRGQEAFERSQRERHKVVLAERAAKREAAKAIARQEGGFIGPPNPFLYRKGRPPMTVTRGK